MIVPFADLRLQHQNLRSDIDNVIDRAIETSSFIGGAAIEEFEHNFKNLVGINHCISCGNGTDALYIAMRGLGLKQGGEVITTAHSWFSTSEAISQCGGKPVFCDTEDDGFCINPELIKSKITDKTVGIVPVHLYGHPAKMTMIMEIAKQYDLWVVEDCAQAHLACLNNKTVGTYGDAATFSFYPGKNLGALGDAGAIVTNNAELAQWCQLFARHGGKGKHVLEGINSRMDSIQAAVLNIKIPHLKSWTEKRINVAGYYSQLLSSIDCIRIPRTASNAVHVFHLYTILAPQRDALRNYLSDLGISTNINYPVSLPFLPAYQSFGYASNEFPNAFFNQQHILSIPMFPEIQTAQQEYVAAAIIRFYAENKLS